MSDPIAVPPLRFLTMRVKPFSPAAFSLALLALLQILFAPDLRGVASASSGELLAAELPAGVTLAAAPTPVLAKALKSAISKREDQAVPLLRVALLSRKKKRKNVPYLVDRCNDPVDLTRAALEASPSVARRLVEEATLLFPECGSALNALLGDSGTGFGFPIRLRDLDAGIIGAPGGFTSVNPANISGPGGQNIVISPER